MTEPSTAASIRRNLHQPDADIYTRRRQLNSSDRCQHMYIPCMLYASRARHPHGVIDIVSSLQIPAVSCCLLHVSMLIIDAPVEPSAVWRGGVMLEQTKREGHKLRQGEHAACSIHAQCCFMCMYMCRCLLTAACRLCSSHSHVAVLAMCGVLHTR